MWTAIVKSAVIGAAQSPLSDSVVPAIGLQTDKDPTETLLEAISVVAALKKGGLVLPEISGAVLDVCPPDDLPIANIPTAQINLLLQARPLLSAWLDLLEQRQFRIPPVFLPVFLDHCLSQLDCTEALFAAGGFRCRWLAAQNRDWAPLLDYVAGDWHTGRFARRLDILSRMRKKDPAAARTLLENSWNTERPDHKVKFLHALAGGLSQSDLPFLNSAAQEKNKDVQLAAQQMINLHSLSVEQCLALIFAPADNLLGDSIDRKLWANKSRFELPWHKAGLLDKIGPAFTAAVQLLCEEGGHFKDNFKKMTENAAALVPTPVLAQTLHHLNSASQQKGNHWPYQDQILRHFELIRQLRAGLELTVA